MRFYTADESEAWLTGQNRSKPDTVEGCLHLRVSYPRESYRILYIARWVATELTYRRPTLLWVTEWEIWPGSENWHLYYRLRQSYGDHRLLQEAPGHLFLEHEMEDLASFFQLSMLNGWGGYVLTRSNYANVFFSHDEFLDIYCDNEDVKENVQKALGCERDALARAAQPGSSKGQAHGQSQTD